MKAIWSRIQKRTDQMGKSVFASRMFWVNAITVAVATAGFVAGHDVIAQYPQVVAGIAVAQGALNIVLRLLTTQPIK
jgi:hypothetical protein